MQEGTGLYLWDVNRSDDGKPPAPSQPLRLCPSITVATSFCMWSRLHAQLAIGTQSGKVIVFNKKEVSRSLAASRSGTGTAWGLWRTGGGTVGAGGRLGGWSRLLSPHG